MVVNNSVNPYAPSIAAPAVKKEGSALQSNLNLNLELVGCPTSQQLRCFIAAERSLSLAGSMAIICLISPLLIISFVEALPGLFAISIGVSGLVLVMHIVSTVQYRVGLFKNQYPQWDALDGGRIDSNGLTLFDGDSWLLYRWVWFSHAIVTRSAISFIPCLQSKCPVLVGETMLLSGASGNAIEEWELFSKSAVDQLERSQGAFYKHRLNIDPSRTRSNLELICDRGRHRTVATEAGAVEFSGDVTTRDLEQIPEGIGDLTRTRRSLVVIVLITLFGGLIAGGVSELWLEAFWILLAFYLMLLLALYVRARTTTVRAFQRRHYFLLGYATDDYLLLDLDISVSRFAWRDMHLLLATDGLIAMKAGRRGQVIVLRPDMFESAEQWERVFNNVTQQETAESRSRSSNV